MPPKRKRSDTLTFSEDNAHTDTKRRLQATQPSASDSDPLRLGTDILIHVVSFLDVFDLVTANQVSKSWRSVLSTWSSPWRAACAGTDADEADRFEGIADPPDGVSSEVHTWRTLALNHVRTENAWSTGNARSFDLTIDGSPPFTNALYVSSRAGVVFLLDTDQQAGNHLDCGLVDRRTWKRLYDLPDSDYPHVTAEHSVVLRWDHDELEVEVKAMNRRSGAITLNSLVNFNTGLPSNISSLGTPNGGQTCVVADIPNGVHVFAPPLWLPEELRIDGRLAGEKWAELIFFPNRRTFAQSVDDITTVYRRTASGTGRPIARFPPANVEIAAIVFNVAKGDKYVGRLWSLPTARVEVEGLIPGDTGFDDAAKPIGPEPWVLQCMCFKNTDIAVVVEDRTVVILRNYADVFAKLVDMPEDKRTAYIVAHTVALQFESLVKSLRGYGHRFAVVTRHRRDPYAEVYYQHVFYFDTRDLPSMPLRLDGGSRPQLHAFVFPGETIVSDPDVRLGVDSRAIYLLRPPDRREARRGEGWKAMVHAFDR